MGLLQTTQKAGLLNKSNPTPSLQGVDFNVTTPQTAFDTTTEIIPRFAQPTTTPAVKTGALTGATTLSQAPLGIVDKVKQSIPSGFAGDVARGVIEAPKQIAEEAGFLDEENVVKLDRLAQALITEGKDATQAYETAGAYLQRGKNVQSEKDLESLNLTPKEKTALSRASLVNSFMTGLTLSNIAPGSGAVTKDVGEMIFKIATSKEENVIAKHLLDIGVPKAKIPTLASTLTEVSKPEVVSDLIKGAISEPKAGLLNKSLSEQMLGSKDTLNAEELSSIVKNSLLNEPKGKFDKPERFTGEGYSYKEAETGLAEDGTYHKNRIVIGYNDKGEQILVDGTHLLEAYRDLGIPIPKDKVEFLPKPKQVITRTPEELAKAKEKLSKKIATPEPKPQPEVREMTPERQDLVDNYKYYFENTEAPQIVRYYDEAEGGYTSYRTSTAMPKDLPEHLRSRELFNKIQDNWNTQTRPTKAGKAQELYDELQKRIDKELSIPSDLKKEVRQPELVPEKGASLEEKASYMRSQTSREKNVKVASLSDIVHENTPVEKKVHIFDTFLRSPEKVMEKIGLSKEYKALERAYNGYSKELPKNIDKVSNWVKEVPDKESAVKIFQKLDGKEVQLTEKEAKVAKEIKVWLEEWADRLGLPKDNRIANYITHLFEEELLKKEFPEEIAKLISDKIPKEIFNQFLMKRTGASGYKENVWEALDAYVKRATRKVHMDPALELLQTKAGVQKEFSRLEESQFEYVQKYIQNINMRPSKIDTSLDNFFKSTFGYVAGQRPTMRMLRALRRLTFMGGIGGNQSTWIRNLSQGANTYAVLGEKYTVNGYMSLMQKGAIKELEEEGVLAGGIIQDRTMSSYKKALETFEKGLFFQFQTAELINRGAAYFGGKAKALAEGKTMEEAIEYGKKVVTKTQFNFDPIHTPVGLNSDIAKTLTQFQTFTIKQGEFLLDQIKDKNLKALFRYAGAGLGFVYTIGQAFDMKPQELIPSLRFETPASLKFIGETAKAVFNAPDKYGQPRTLEQKVSDIGKSFTGLIPASSQIKKTYQGEELIRKGGSFDKSGNLQFEAPQTTAGKAQALLFGKYSGQKAQQYFDRGAESKKDMEDIKPFYDQIQQLKKEGRTQEALEIYDSLGEKGKEVYKKVKSQAKAEETKQGKQDFLPTFQKIRALKDTNQEEAVRMYNALSDDEKKYYQLLKKQLEK